MLFKWKVAGVAVAVIALYVGYLKLDNARLVSKVETVEAEKKHDVAEAHIEEIDTSLAERLKAIKEDYDENITIESADDNGSWVDDFGL